MYPHNAQGDFFAPTILTGVTQQMRIWNEEVFGPVMVVVPFQNDGGAVALTNDSRFGLGSNVFSKSMSHANFVASQLEVCPSKPSAPLFPLKPVD